MYIYIWKHQIKKWKHCSFDFLGSIPGYARVFSWLCSFDFLNTGEPLWHELAELFSLLMRVASLFHPSSAQHCPGDQPQQT